MSDQSEQMQGIRMPGIDLQDLPVELFGLLEIARLVVLKGQSERLRPIACANPKNV